VAAAPSWNALCKDLNHTRQQLTEDYTAVELRTGVFAGEETPVLNQSEV
jgi:hypothetical protein